MRYFFLSGFVILFSFGFVSRVCACVQDREPETPDWRMTLKTIRNGIHKIDTYLNAALDLFGGEDGLCHYKCSDGYKPVPRHGYRPPPPNGCGSPIFGVQFDIGIPSMTKCCNQHDRCYDTCGSDKHDCDEQFQVCLETICRNVQRTLGLSQSVQACESTVRLLFDAVMHLGCKPYLDSQRASCMCLYEDRQELSTGQTVKRQTENLRVDYYVSREFKLEYKGSALQKIEKNVEEDYVSSVRNNCWKERQTKTDLLYAAKVYRDERLRRKAEIMTMDNCKELDRLNMLYRGG